MFYLGYLCLLAYNGVQHIFCCVFALFFFVLCSLSCQFLWIVHLWLSLRYFLTFIQIYWNPIVLFHSYCYFGSSNVCLQGTLSKMQYFRESSSVLSKVGIQKLWNPIVPCYSYYTIGSRNVRYWHFMFWIKIKVHYWPTKTLFWIFNPNKNRKFWFYPTNIPVKLSVIWSKCFLGCFNLRWRRTQSDDIYMVLPCMVVWNFRCSHM